MKILIVEDEDSIREVEKAYLVRNGFEVVEAIDGESAITSFKKDTFDIVLLDLNLPSIDGIEVCKVIRKTSQVPIIMVTARSEEIDEIVGLEIGADDYIKKPFSPNILVARIQNLLKRLGSGIITIADLSIDPEKMIAKKGDEKLLLTTTQFNILYLLASKPGKVFTRDEILEKAYDNVLDSDILSRTIDAHIKSIRKALKDDPAEPKYINTIIGRGYKFNE